MTARSRAAVVDAAKFADAEKFRIDCEKAAAEAKEASLKSLRDTGVIPENDPLFRPLRQAERG